MAKEYPYGAQAAAKINPKMLEASGYGEFKYMKSGDTGYWKFDTELGRRKFLKDYAGLDAKEATPFDDMAYYATAVGGITF